MLVWLLALTLAPSPSPSPLPVCSDCPRTPLVVDYEPRWPGTPFAVAGLGIALGAIATASHDTDGEPRLRDSRVPLVWAGAGGFVVARAFKYRPPRGATRGRSRVGGLDGFVREAVTTKLEGLDSDQAAKVLRRRLAWQRYADIAFPAAVGVETGVAVAAPTRRLARMTAVGEAAALSAGTAEVMQWLTGRWRPYAASCECADVSAICRDEARRSFFSSRTTLTFAMVVAGKRLSGMAGDGHAWRHWAALGLASSGAIAELAGDSQRFTDVLASVAVGAAAGHLIAGAHRARDQGPIVKEARLPSEDVALSVGLGANSAVGMGWSHGPVLSFHYRWR